MDGPRDSLRVGQPRAWRRGGDPCAAAGSPGDDGGPASRGDRPVCCWHPPHLGGPGRRRRVVAQETRAMIASWRGVIIAGAIAVMLAVAAIVDLASAPAALDRALVPGFEAERVTGLSWERAGQPVIDVVRTPTSWQIRAPA